MKRIFPLVVLAACFVFGCEGDYTIYDMHPPEIIEVEVPVEVPVEVIVEVPVEVLVEVPGEGGDVWIDSFDQPYVMDGIDIVWLIDKSGSMNQHANVSSRRHRADDAIVCPPSGWRSGDHHNRVAVIPRTHPTVPVGTRG